MPKKVHKAKGLPAYAEVGLAAQGGAPSVFCSKVTLCGFFIPVNAFPALLNTCEKAFDAPSNSVLKCAPLDPVVLLLIDTTSWIGDKQAGTPGFMQSEALFQVPVLITNSATGKYFPAFFTPWIFVDNTVSMIAGREVQGYPKTFGSIIGLPTPVQGGSLATIPVPPPLASAPNLTVKVYGADQNDLYFDCHTLVQVAPQVGAEAGLQVPGVLGLLAAGQLPLVQPATQTLLNAWSTPGTTSQFFFKEFPDIADTKVACLQQITAADYQINNVYSFQTFPSPFDLTIQHLDSHDVCASLGIPAHATVWGFQAVLDFTLENGRVVWP